MKTSAEGLSLIEEFEGCRLKAYQDGAGVWTLGYGHTSGVRSGEYESEEQAKADLCQDVESAESSVMSLVRVELSQNQFDALVSFCYNEGSGRLRGSTLLRLLNAGSYVMASGEFPKWDLVGGAESAGLLRRRVAEQELFCRS